MEKLKSWQYSSLGSDDLLADLDEMVAEVTRNYIDSDSDSDGTVADVAVSLQTALWSWPNMYYWQFSCQLEAFADVDPE